VRTDLVMEGGAIEVDGNGTAIITESCVLNKNRNPGWTKKDVEEELAYLLGVRKIIWLPGVAGKDITDGHTDFYARFTSPTSVVAAYDPDPASFDHNVTKTHLDILRNATDAQGRRLNVTVLTAPTRINPDYEDVEDFAAGYINFYVCNRAVIMPKFGDRSADAAARDSLVRLFPNRTIEMVSIDGIAGGGGGIHCATQQEIA
jgi:agmatine deiminase